MFTRFTTITNGLNALSRYMTQELVNKILESLWKAYQGKIVVIQEEEDLSKLILEELIGLLMIDEIMMKDHNQEDEKDKKK